MRSGSIFWGIVFTVIGVLALGGTLGWFGSLSIWSLIWPAFLLILGVWIIVRPRTWRAHRHGEVHADAVSVNIPVDNAAMVELMLRHGAGRIDLSTGSDPAMLLTGTVEGASTPSVSRPGETARIEIRGDEQVVWSWPDRGPNGLEWRLQLNPAIPCKLDIETGASENNLDLSGLKVSELKYTTGASKTTLTLPQNAGYTRVKLESGAASLAVRVPDGVAARIHTSSALIDRKIDTNRFPQTGDNFETPGFDTSANRVEINIETGVGSLEIR